MKPTSIAPQKNSERLAAIMITDMAKYSTQTADMTPLQISEFIISYHELLQEKVFNWGGVDIQYTPIAGDSSVTIFPLEDENSKTLPLSTALSIANEVQSGNLLPTRFGMYIGPIIEAHFYNHKLAFGNSFAAASRLEQLCKHFQTTLLFDRTIAQSNPLERDWMVSIGKITPKNFIHPIHVYSAYKPGINGCQLDIDKDSLKYFITQKNLAMDHFMGNQLTKIFCNFSKAQKYLLKAQTIYKDITGKIDIPTQIILEYLNNNPAPTKEFRQYGMRLGEVSSEIAKDVFLKYLPDKLLKALDYGSYKILVEQTQWEQCFQLDWRSKGDMIIEYGNIPDGIYYIESGKINVLDKDKNKINSLSSGDIFGEMSYFSRPGIRNAYIIADTDVAMRKILWDDCQKYPELMKILSEISTKRHEENI